MDQAVKEYFAVISRMGGKARAKKLTPVQRAESARKAAEARWARIDKNLAESGKRAKALDKTLSALESKIEKRKRAKKKQTVSP